MELTYTQVGDYLIPNIAVPDTPHHTLGKYGRMRRTYLKAHRPILWERMILDGTLWQHLADVDQTCYEREEKKRFEELMSCHSTIVDTMAYESFRSGLQLGIMLIMDAVSDSRSALYDL